MAVRGHRRERPAWLVDLIVVGGLLGLVSAYVLPTLGDPLLEGYHAFRQTQTAFPARIFSEEGIDLLHPQVPVLGAPFEIPFEFPLFQAIASVLMDLGVSETVSLRLTGFLGFLATALLLFGLVRHVAARTVAICAVVAFALFPFSLVWSRTSMIEYLATAGALGWAWGVISWRERGRTWIGALALVAGLVGMLVKPTTAVFWLTPALAHRVPPRSESSGSRSFTCAGTGLIAALPVVAAILWTRHADAVKAASQTTAWLASGELGDWNLGSLDQRLAADTWETILDRLRGTVVLSLWIFLPVAAIAGFRSGRLRRFWLGVAATVVLPLLVFTNLYYVHEYYLAAITPGLAALVGLGAAHVWSVLPRHRAVLGGAALFGVLLVAASLARSDHYWYGTETIIREPENLPLAVELASVTEPDDLVATVGLDWSPVVFFHAHRRGHMVVAANEAFAYDLIHDESYHHVLVARPDETNLDFLRRWRWVGALGPHTFAVADDAAELPTATFAATGDIAATRRFVASGESLLARPLELSCGRPVEVPAGADGVWLEVDDPPPGATIAAGVDLVALPARARMFVGAQGAARGSVTLTCRGATALTILRAVAGRQPG